MVSSKRTISYGGTQDRQAVTTQKPHMGFFKTVWQIVISGVIVSVLLFIIVNFYLFSSIVSLDTFIIIFLILSLMTDGAFLLMHLVRRPVKKRRYEVDKSKVSAVIACYNGADEIGETIEHLLHQIPRKQIFIVSDASTDNTVEVAKSYGVNVIKNKRNLNKAFSVSVGVHYVKTPYVLILDDDVLIGNTTIPTNLMDEGYSAVAFDVMPIKTDTFVNAIQQFEYRSSMHIGKNLRASASAIGNVSGAIGLYRTDDLREQAYLHSGQFAGEDEQRTLLSHIYGRGKGITFSEETVFTHVPNTFHALYRQRAYSWNLSVPELLPLYMNILFSPKYHYLLKTEKAYSTYIYLTDPLRILFLWTLLLRPRYLVLTYGLYVLLNTAMWLKTKRKDQFLVVIMYPFYTLWLSFCRFIGNFYWFKVKAVYFKKRFHRMVYNRRIVLESIAVMAVFITTWVVSGYHFSQDMRLFNKIRSSRLESQEQAFNYDSDQSQQISGTDGLNLPFSKQAPSVGTYMSVDLEKGDTVRAVAHKAVDKALESRTDVRVPYDKRYKVDMSVVAAIQKDGAYLSTPTSTLLIDSAAVNQAIDKGLQA